jgi:hypothetical protein
VVPHQMLRRRSVRRNGGCSHVSRRSRREVRQRSEGKTYLATRSTRQTNQRPRRPETSQRMAERNEKASAAFQRLQSVSSVMPPQAQMLPQGRPSRALTRMPKAANHASEITISNGQTKKVWANGMSQNRPKRRDRPATTST